MSFYAVAVGRNPGIYLTWAKAEIEVKGFPGAKYRKFPDRISAESFVNGDVSRPASSSETIETDISPYHRVFTDGSFMGGLAGFGWVFILAGSDSVSSTNCGSVKNKLTNNTGELTAILDAITKISHRPLHVYADSKYSIKCVTEWYPKWERNGFKTSTGTPVANLELIQAIRKNMIGEIHFHHIKAHQGHIWNEMADTLAKQGRLM